MKVPNNRASQKAVRKSPSAQSEILPKVQPGKPPCLSEVLIKIWERADSEKQANLAEELKIAAQIITARITGTAWQPCSLLLPPLDPCKN
jgi:hypothetical protein